MSRRVGTQPSAKSRASASERTVKGPALDVSSSATGGGSWSTNVEGVRASLRSGAKARGRDKLAAFRAEAPKVKVGECLAIREYSAASLDQASIWLTGDKGRLEQIDALSQTGRFVLGTARSLLLGADSDRHVFVALPTEFDRCFHANQQVSDQSRRLVFIPQRWLRTTDGRPSAIARVGVAFCIADSALEAGRFEVDVHLSEESSLRQAASQAIADAGYLADSADDDTVDAVAASIVALNQASPRELTFSMVREFFDGCLLDRENVSVIEAAVLHLLQGRGHVQLFSERAQALIFETSDLPAVSLGRSSDVLTRFGVEPKSELFVDASRELLLESKRLSNTLNSEATQMSGMVSYREAVDYVCDVVRFGRAPDLDDILYINKLLLNGVEGQVGGVFRAGQLYAGAKLSAELRRYPEGRQVEPLMKEFADWFAVASENVAAGTGSAESFAASVYRKLVSIHPFGDANGRTGRLAASLCLMSHGLPPPYVYTLTEALPSVYVSRSENMSESQYAEHFAVAVSRAAQFVSVVAGNDAEKARRECDSEVGAFVDSYRASRQAS